ncbi:unnamed protein product [Penicillium bialowiezense]
MSSTPHDAPAAPAAPAGSAPSLPLTNAETPVNAPGPIAVDDFTDDSNSEFDNDDLTSLSESVLEFEYENGRRYCSTRSGTYM